MAQEQGATHQSPVNLNTGNIHHLDLIRSAPAESVSFKDAEVVSEMEDIRTLLINVESRLRSLARALR